MKKMKSVFTVLCAAFSGLFLASVFAGAGGVAKSSDKLAEDVAATPDALTTSSSSTLPKFVDHRDYLATGRSEGIRSHPPDLRVDSRNRIVFHRTRRGGERV